MGWEIAREKVSWGGKFMGWNFRGWIFWGEKYWGGIYKSPIYAILMTYEEESVQSLVNGNKWNQRGRPVTTSKDFKSIKAHNITGNVFRRLQIEYPDFDTVKQDHYFFWHWSSPMKPYLQFNPSLWLIISLYNVCVTTDDIEPVYISCL